MRNTLAKPRLRSLRAVSALESSDGASISIDCEGMSRAPFPAPYQVVGLLIVAPHRHGLSDEDALDLIQADRIIGAVIELRRARRLMIRDLPTVLIGRLPLRVTRRTLRGQKTRCRRSVSSNAVLN